MQPMMSDRDTSDYEIIERHAKELNEEAADVLDYQDHFEIESTKRAMNKTLAIIKPDAVSAGSTGKIIDRIIADGFRIRAMKMIHQTRRQAEGFYDVHRGKPFFEGLTEFMSSAPCIVMVLEKEGAVKAWRDLMGATDPAKADAGTILVEDSASRSEPPPTIMAPSPPVTNPNNPANWTAPLGGPGSGPFPE